MFGALLLRLLYLATILDSPYFLHPITDEAMYDAWAQALVAGQTFLDYPYYDSPLPAYFLALIYGLFGHSYLMVRLVQVFLGTLNVLILYRIAQRLFEPTTAKVAGLLAATYLPFLYFEGLLLKESVALFLLDSSVLLILGALARPTWLAFWSAGVTVGLLSLSRINALALVAACLILIVASLERRTMPRAALALSLGVAMVIAPVTIRNKLVSGDWILITVSGGQVLYTANNPANQTGDLAPVPFVRPTSLFERIDFHRRAEAETGHRMTPAEVGTYWRHKSLAFSLEHPLTQARMVGQRILRFWNKEELPDNHSIEIFKRFSWVLRAPLPAYWLVGPFVLVGLILLYPRRRELGILYLSLAFYLLSLLPFWVSTRYRLPIVGLLILFAAAGMTESFRRVRTGQARAWVPPAALLAGACLFCWMPMPMPDLPSLERNLAYAYEQDRQYEKAIEIYERLRGVEQNPDNELYLAHALGLAGRMDEARALLNKLTEPTQPASVRHRAFNFLGDLARLARQWPEAEQAYRAALTLDPTDYGAWNNLAVALTKQERYREGERALEQSILLAPEDRIARQNLELLRRHLNESTIQPAP
ncbi:MAG: glycosyltransferase family 39 protein [Nitrospirota bacterium]|nr:glycosyltransferase family 39 protein [Nitrospirota bacterium]